MAENYVVTGGAGFIGSHIAEKLIKDGQRVRIVDNFITGKRENLAALNGDFELHEVSITDLEGLRRAFKGATYVVHQAALPSVPRSILEPLVAHEHNATGTLNVLIAARDAGVQRVVYAGSSSAYGDAGGDPKDESIAPSPLSPYGVSKLTGEYYCRVFTEVYGLQTVALRYFNVFGPRQDETSQYSAVIPLFITAMLQGKQPTIYGDGKQSRDFTFVENVVHGNLLALTAPEAPGKVMNLAMGASIDLLYLVAEINQILGTSIQPVHATGRIGEIRRSRASIERAGELIGYEPLVDFSTGLRRTVEWYRERLRL